MPESNKDCQPQSDLTEAGQQDQPEVVVHEHSVRRRVVGRRLDKYLRGRYPRISRTTIQRFIKQGQVTVNGTPTKASYEPSAGDVVAITLPPPPPSELVPEPIPIDIIYEDEWMMAINKQAGIVCHPARATQSGTIANGVAYHAKTLSKGSDPFRPGIVHRLDKNTTGIMLIAKTDEAHWRMSLQFERRTIRKEYFAVCEGHIKLDGDVINQPLAPHPDTTQRMILRTANPPRQAMFKESVTEYRVKKRYRGFTTVELFPKTGRTHQLRVHMMAIGHPMAGDAMYGGHSVTESFLRGQPERQGEEPIIQHQALHAHRIKLVHPIREKLLELEAPLPPLMLRLIALLDESRSDTK